MPAACISSRPILISNPTLASHSSIGFFILPAPTAASARSLLVHSWRAIHLKSGVRQVCSTKLQSTAFWIWATACLIAPWSRRRLTWLTELQSSPARVHLFVRWRAERRNCRSPISSQLSHRAMTCCSSFMIWLNSGASRSPSSATGCLHRYCESSSKRVLTLKPRGQHKHYSGWHR